jgi:uncharacterized delta-60 repeat protein
MRYLLFVLTVLVLAACDQNKLPTASFTLTPESGEVPLEVTVNSVSTDADGSVANVTWDWGDGSATDTGATSTHTFSGEGSFTVKLTVTDNEGASATSEKIVTVTTSGPNPNPDPDPDPNPNPDPEPNPNPEPSGVLDESFSEDGKAVVQTDESDFIVDTVVQKDGKIVTLGTQVNSSSEGFFVIRRFNPDGTLDNSFGTRGSVIMDENFGDGGATFFKPNLSAALAVQEGGSNDGRICLVGTGFNQPDVQGEDVDQARAIIACLTSVGDPDNTFDDNAFAFPFSNEFTILDDKTTPENEEFIPDISASDIHIDAATGDITIGATLTDVGGDEHFWFFRLPRNGFNDDTDNFEEFDVKFGFLGGKLNAFTVLDNGDIIAVGSDNDDPDSTDSILARLSKNGLLLANKTFNLSTGGDRLADVSIDSKGNVIAAGDIFLADGPGFLFKGVIARFNANSLDLDTSFGVAGKVITENSVGTNVGFRALELDTQDRIIVAGEQEGNFNVSRFLTDGKPDPSFGTNGQTLVDFGASDVANALALDADGKIIAAGFTRLSGSNDFALARLTP